MYRSAAFRNADIVVSALLVLASLASLALPHRRHVLVATTLLSLPFALGVWALAYLAFVIVAIALNRAHIPLLLRCVLVFLAWLAVPILRVVVFDVDLQASTIFLALVWGGLLYATFLMLVERARAFADEKPALIDDVFYLLAPPRLVSPFFQPISPREMMRAEKPAFPRRPLLRAAWLAFYGLLLAVVAHQLQRIDHNIAFHFVAAYARFAYTIILAVAVFRLLGFDLPPGFRFPFISRSFAEFFRRFNHYVRDAVLSLFYFPILGHLRHKLTRRIAAIVSSYLAILAGSLALHDLLVPVGISPHPVVTLAAYLRPRRIITLAILWTLIVLPTAGIAPRKEVNRSKLRTVLQIVAVDVIYVSLWYFGER